MSVPGFALPARPEAAPSGAAPDLATHASLALVLLLGLVHVIDLSIVGALITPLKQAFGLTDEELARLGSVFTFAGMVGAPVAGVLTARLGRKTTLLLGALVWSASAAATGLAGGLATLLLWRVLTGFGEAAYSVLAPSWLADLYRPAWRSLVMSAYMVKNKVGAAIALALGGWAAARYGWNVAFVLAGVPGLLLLVPLAFAREPVPGASDGQAAAGARRVTFREGMQVLRYPGFVINTAATVLFFAGMTGQTWIPAYLHRTYDLPNDAASLALAQILLYTTPAGLVGGYLSSRYLRRRAWAFPAFLTATTALAAGLLFEAYRVRDLALALGLIGAGTATFGLAMGPLSTLAMETVPPPLRPYAGVVTVPVLGLSMIVVGQGFGLASDAWGLANAMFLSPAGYLASGVAWLVFLLWRARNAAGRAYY